MQKTVVLIGVGLLVLATGHAMAGTSSADQVFAVKAAAGGEAEVVLGRLATERAGSQQVRQFVQQMVADHSKASQELQAIAKQQNLTLPTKPDAASTAMQQRLQAKFRCNVRCSICEGYGSGSSGRCRRLPKGGYFGPRSCPEGVCSEISPGVAASPPDDAADQHGSVTHFGDGMFPASRQIVQALRRRSGTSPFSRNVAIFASGPLGSPGYRQSSQSNLLPITVLVARQHLRRMSRSSRSSRSSTS